MHPQDNLDMILSGNNLQSIWAYMHALGIFEDFWDDPDSAIKLHCYGVPYPIFVAQSKLMMKWHIPLIC